MYFPTEARILYRIALSLLVLSSFAIAADHEEMIKNHLRGNVVEDIISNKTDEISVVKEDSHHLDGLPPKRVLLVEEDPLTSIYGNENISIYDGIWGSWKPLVKTHEAGLYACGAELRFEDPGGDDTAGNGLKLKFCGLHDWYNQEEKTIYDGNWGSWKGMKMCPYGKYIGAAKVRFEDGQGAGDDTALNGLQIWCVDKNWYGGEIIMVYPGVWGSWKDWSYEIDKLVKGARVRSEDGQDIGDDTALNGIQFNIEKPNVGVSRDQIIGEWAPIASGPQGQITHKIIESTETTTGEEVTKEESYSFTQSISAGFKIKAFDFSASATATQSFRTAQVIKHSLRVFKATETTLGCPKSGSPTGYYTMWQFIMSQPSDASGIGFKSRTKHIRCTPSYALAPKCALGSCKDAFCQTCFD
jgi:hypothetical protein